MMRPRPCETKMKVEQLQPLCLPAIAAVALMFVPSVSAWADLTFYTDESAWNNDVSDIEVLDFTATNVALADEVSSPPGGNEELGGVLTFDSANTGLSSSLTLIALESGDVDDFGDGFMFDDNEGSGPEWDDALSVGDINNFEDDDWQITFDSGSVFNFAWLLQDNNGNTGESFSVYDTSDSLLGTFNGIPATAGIDFVGVTSTVAIGRVEFDEDTGGDDIAIGGIRLSSTAVPEPSSFAVIGIAVTGLCVIRRRRT